MVSPLFLSESEGVFGVENITLSVFVSNLAALYIFKQIAETM